ncbi:ketosteroid isomerase-related protein [Roseococcus microcysteis]|uniref:ketosteroid isomerase-related protein n=1 Tax=Roseococcus microcysteis TaxID=2771361 RepID=UPI00168BC62E|nr:ketosteroid isomerase-related protein [Roseococcus microcysteis]
MSGTELLRRYYAAFNAGDWDGMAALLTEDVAHDVNQGGRETGRAAFRAFLDRMAHHYAERVEDLVVMESAEGTRAAAEFTIHGRYLVTDSGLPEARGQSYALPVGAFFEITGGKIARVTNFYNLQEWIAQVS